MDQFNQLFDYASRYGIIICRECRIGCLLTQCSTHLAARHAHLTARSRREMVQFAAGIKGFAMTEDQVVWPVSGSDPIPGLAIYKDGLRCTAKATTEGLKECGYINRDIRNMKSHCRKEHGWVSKQRGRPADGLQPDGEKSWIQGIHCQKFAGAGKLGKLFEVNSQEEEKKMDAVGRGAQEEEVEISQQLEEMFANISSQLKKAEENLYSTVEPDENRFIPNAWLDRTGWAKHLSAFNRAWLRSLVQRPRRNERALAKLSWAVETVIYKAQKSSTTKVMGLASMNYINRREAGNDSNEKPLNTRQTGLTMIRYSRVWVGLIGYIWRTFKLEAVLPAAGNGGIVEEDEEGEGWEEVTQKRPMYQLTARQQECLSRIIDIVGEDKDEDDSEGMQEEEEEAYNRLSIVEESEYYSKAGEYNIEDMLEDEEEAQLENKVLAFLLSLLDHQLKDNEYQSVLISAAAVFGVDVNQGWKSVLAYTPVLSAIITRR
ncbi:hypothetical protein M501DRAFT_1019740 [Patellaria atrata CBS 101060]|uniref:Uncharacterized protein n=1 Tax=Patellaria atrata CBS 101060 TaxID=1346257 RepID=A0A9P4S3T8_9PEZI|nr:hypothetical protein M501DRAFT_1019740 [Patellaria atrata CBS 101060]